MTERDWASLERGLLHDIFTRLPADADVDSFRHVCHHWRVAAVAGAPVSRPWFVLSRPSVNGTVATHAYIQPAQRHGRSRIRAIHKEDVTTIKEEWAPSQGSSRGWVAVSEGENNLLLRDPISRVEVPLPPIDPVCQLFSIFLSDDPLDAPTEFTAFGFFKRTDSPYQRHLLAFCRSSDGEWTRIDADADEPEQIWYFQGLEFFRGRAYVLLRNYSVAVVDVDARRLVLSTVNLSYPCHNLLYTQESLVEADGDLLFVQVRQTFVEKASRSPCCIRRSYDLKFLATVTKIELDADGMPVQLSDIVEIGDYAYFLGGQGHAFALRACGFPAIKAECVYHFSTYCTTSVPRMIVSDLLQQPQRHEIVRKFPLAGPRRPVSWFCPRRPILNTTMKRR
ncbi:hypothetical protein QOZ80_2BG0167250 [Eleusine coracana subsp. coracana]|nr:hypothetical protein QOZ80_2BG0167250 [Eleusine coracana subsp. coracana]